MKRTIVALTAVAVAGGAFAAELAYTVRPTEMKAKPFSDASTITKLAESSKVDVLARQTSWIQVKADGNNGWVKMLSLRFDQPQAGSTANSNVGVLFNIAATGKGGSTATTGVRGINEENLRNPTPNMTALREVNERNVSPAEVQAFAKAGKLMPKSLDYVAIPGAKK